MSKNLEEMSGEELRAEFLKKKEQIEEIEEERDFLLNHTNKHIPGNTCKKYEAEIKRLQMQMERIEELLKEQE